MAPPDMDLDVVDCELAELELNGTFPAVQSSHSVMFHYCVKLPEVIINVVANEVDRMLIEDLLIVRGTAGIGKRKGVVEIVIAEEVVWVIEIRVEVVTKLNAKSEECLERQEPQDLKALVW
ncbi:MAG: hypothetical protein ASARMPRED_007963 [Alectoria sarmentosa]|nr:MAG: hypothetical protein ASARMPRED_007963 [Alectoria sarmentosa]